MLRIPQGYSFGTDGGLEEKREAAIMWMRRQRVRTHCRPVLVETAAVQSPTLLAAYGAIERSRVGYDRRYASNLPPQLYALPDPDLSANGSRVVSAAL